MSFLVKITSMIKNWNDSYTNKSLAVRPFLNFFSYLY
jgi:hypothetical protein